MEQLKQLKQKHDQVLANTIYELQTKGLISNTNDTPNDISSRFSIVNRLYNIFPTHIPFILESDIDRVYISLFEVISPYFKNLWLCFFTFNRLCPYRTIVCPFTKDDVDRFVRRFAT